MAKRKSILFVNPDYHTSFILRDELRARGWAADVFVPRNYPKKLLFSEDGFRIANDSGILFGIRAFFMFLYFIVSYKYFFIYNNANVFSFPDRMLKLLFGSEFCFDLALLKLLGKKVIYLPSGCCDLETKENFSKLDNGNVCNSCGWSENICNDDNNRRKLNIKKRYGDLFVGQGINDSGQLSQTHLRYKSLDLKLWNPELVIPPEFLLPATDAVRIMHSFFSLNRKNYSRNIKGSNFIIEAIDKLKREGLAVELIYLEDIPLKFMRYYQVQADIIVEQLIYGWWGSTGVETMCLGKPIVCYLRAEWKKAFFNNFPEYDSLPIVEADRESIYDVLKQLVVDRKLREDKGHESRLFAERHFDVKKNAVNLEKVLLGLK